jgi:hypothetical protein
MNSSSPVSESSLRSAGLSHLQLEAYTFCRFDDALDRRLYDPVVRQFHPQVVAHFIFAHVSARVPPGIFLALTKRRVRTNHSVSPGRVIFPLLLSGLAPNSCCIWNFAFMSVLFYRSNESGPPPAFFVRVGSWKVKQESGLRFRHKEIL